MPGIDPSELLPFVLVGFLAQIVDGAMGMAFGVISNTLLVAPIGALLARRIDAQRLLFLVGVVLTATSLFSLYRALA